MNRSKRWMVWSLLMVLVAGGWALAQEPTQVPKKEKKVAEAKLAEEDPMMKAALEAGAPGEHHEHLEALVGSWSVRARIYMGGPDAEPIESRANAVNEMVLGGRFLLSTMKGDFMGVPFVAYGYEGYNKGTETHEAVWMDSMGTGLQKFEGTCAQDGKQITVHAEMLDPMTGKMKQNKGVTTIRSRTMYTYESWDKVEGADDYVKVMEAIFTKTK